MAKYEHHFLSNDEIEKIAPAIFAEKPHDRVSERYSFIPTIQVIDSLRNQGWDVVKVGQSKVRANSSSTILSQPHYFRMRRKDDETDLQVDDILDELVGYNAHNARKELRFMSGLFRLVCENGMVIADQLTSNVKLKHIGFAPEEAIELISKHTQSISGSLAQVKEYKSVDMNEMQSINFAKKAQAVVWKEQKFEPAQLLIARRDEDVSKDLWTKFNIVQENIIKGGIQYRTEDAKRGTKTRGIKDAQRDLKVNVALWSLLEQTYNSLRG